MSSYVKPQVLVFQEFRIVPTEITEPLRAHIAGPNGILHRYSNADEKKQIRLGAYDRLNDTCYPWPQRLPGSLVDQDYVKVYIDDALLNYYSHELSDPTTTINAVEGKANWIKSNDTSFKSNTSAFPRESVFGDRDVQLGDVVYLRSVSNDDECEQTELWTEVTGFASEKVSSRIKAASADNANQNTVTATASVPSSVVNPTTGYNYLQVAGPKNCVKLTAVDGSDYDGRLSGDVSETYTIQVVKSSIAGCSAARVRVRSASGRDDVLETAAPVLGEEFAVGTRGLKVTFDVLVGENAGTCATDASSAEVAENLFVTGQKWEVSVRQAYTAVVATSAADGNFTIAGEDDLSPGDILGAYNGAKNDVYIIEVTKGGTVNPGAESYPEVMVRTVKGLDFSGPHEVVLVTGGEGELAEIGIGSNGVAVQFNAPTGFRKGDKFYIPVVSAKAGPVRQLILRDDLPAIMQEAESLDLKLFIKDNIQVSKNRIGYAPQTNYWFEDTQVCLQEGIIAYHPEWTVGGVEQPLDVISGTVYVEYREWAFELADEVNSISDVADLDQIPGQLDPDNPLKWGVYKALSNSNGTVVKYTAVLDPKNLDSWVQVLERIKGRDDMYNLVPMTFDRRVQNLWAAHIGGESNEYANNWKAGFFALKAETHQLVVGKGALVRGVLGEVIEDEVLATLSDDPNATDTQYTLLQVPAGTDNKKGYFITNDVRPGDIVRYNFATDGFGEVQYEEYVVDRVLSENSLLLYTGGDAAVTQPQQFEIWHNRNRNEVADHIAEQGGSLSNRRVCAVWPDQVGEAGTVQPGYYLAAALAGLVSGVVPHQPLTNVEVAGFDDFTRSYKYFNETQLNRMAEAGVWIVTEDKDGTPHTRHALTTDNLDLNRREEMIRRNVDSMSYLFLRRLRPFIGRTNAQPGMERRLKFEVTAIIDFLKANGNTEELGSQLIDGTIRKLQIHPLLKDRIEIVLDLVVPAPLNNIELHLVV
ncbi:MAG: hypothetical protein EBZ69_00665 [Alphaproteobacteria bacterium]|nr:hypothetical protein [Alphaproteobacteria bacterium]